MKRMNNKKKTVILWLAGTLLFCGLSRFTDNTGLKIFFMVMALWSVGGAGWRLVDGHAKEPDIEVNGKLRE